MVGILNISNRIEALEKSCGENIENKKCEKEGRNTNTVRINFSKALTFDESGLIGILIEVISKLIGTLFEKIYVLAKIPFV